MRLVLAFLLICLAAGLLGYSNLGAGVALLVAAVLILAWALS